MGKGGGGQQQQQPTSTTVTNTNLPAWAQPYSEKLLGQAGALTDINQNPYQQYQGQRLADFTPMQQQAFNTVNNMQVSPQNQQATNLAGAAGLGSLGAGQQYNRMATDPGAIQAFMSPYQQNVTDYQKQQAVMDYGRQLPGMGAAASNKGAFGGSRHAIVEAEGQRNLQNQLAGIQATGSQNAFQNAQQAQQFGSSLGLQGYNQALQGASTLGQLGQNQYGQQMGINAAQQQAGAQQQAFNQQGLSNLYQDFLNRQNYPYQQLGFMSDILHGTPTGGITTTQNSQVAPSMFSQIAGSLGGLGSLAGAYNAFGKGAAGGEVKSYAEGGTVGHFDAGGIASLPDAATMLAAKDINSGKANLPDKVALGGDITRLLMASMQLKETQARLEAAKLASGANPQTNVAQDIAMQQQQLDQGQQPQQMAQAPQQGMPPQGMPPQGMPPQQPQGPTMMGAEGGLASLPVHNFDPDNYAGGGIIAFGEPDGDQQVPKPQGAEVPYSQAGRWLGGVADTITQSGSNFADWIAKQRQQHAIELEINKLDTDVFESISDKERNERLQKQKVLQTRVANLLDNKTKDSPPIAEAVKKEDAPVSVRNNNPGNIVDPKTGKFRVFQTPEEGDAALERDLAGKLNGTSPAYKARFGDAPVTPLTLAETWSPASATGNSKDSTNNYAKSIAAKLGVDVNTPIPNTPEAMKAVKQAITAFESGAYTGRNKTATSVPLPPVVTLPSVPGIPGALPRDATNTRPYPENSRYASASPLAPFANQDAAQAAADDQAGKPMDVYDRFIKQNEDDKVGYKAMLANQKGPEAVGDSESYLPQVVSLREKALKAQNLPTDKEFHDKRVTEITAETAQAKKDRDVDRLLALSAGFFKMAAGKSPYALQNFADGMGVTVEQVKAAESEFRKGTKARQESMTAMEQSRRQVALGYADKAEAFRDKAQNLMEKWNESQSKIAELLMANANTSTANILKAKEIAQYQAIAARQRGDYQAERLYLQQQKQLDDLYNNSIQRIRNALTTVDTEEKNYMATDAAGHASRLAKKEPDKLKPAERTLLDTHNKKVSEFGAAREKLNQQHGGVLDAQQRRLTGESAPSMRFDEYGNPK